MSICANLNDSCIVVFFLGFGNFPLYEVYAIIKRILIVNFMFNTTVNSRLAGVLDFVSYLSLFLQVLLVPLFLDKHLANFYVLPKQAFFISLLLFNILLWAVKIILLKKIIYRRSILDAPLLALFLAAFFSSVFSVNIYDSFLGRTDWFGVSFIFLAFAIIFYFVLVNQLATVKQWRWLVDGLLFSGAAAALLFLLKAIFKVSLPGLENIWNITEGTNTAFGIWTIFNFFLASVFIMRKNLPAGRSLFYFFLVLAHAVVLLVLGFSVLWWILLAGLILALLLGVIFLNEARMGWLSFLFGLLIATAVFIAFGSPRAVQGLLPAEISLAPKASWNIASETIFSGVKNFVFGSGLGTFGTDFSRFKTVDFNYNSLAWSLRFNQPANTFLAILAEGGIITFLALVFILLFVLGYAAHMLYRLRQTGFLKNLSSRLSGSDNDLALEVFALLAGWILLWVGGAINFYGPALWWLWWLVLGLVIFGLRQLGDDAVIREKVWTLEDTPQHNLVFSFALIIVMAAVVMIGVLGARFYLAEYNYARALGSADLATAENYLNKAVAQRGNFDLYQVALARVYLSQAADEARKSQPQVDHVAGLMAKAVNSAKKATDLSPQSVAIWENLATMYENAAVLVPEARDWAIKTLTQAVELEPVNPILRWRLGNMYMQMKDTDKAIENYQSAIELKRDYIGAYVSLADAYEQKQNINKAIESYSVILPAANQNPEVLFNLGRLFFNRHQKGDADNAEKLWLEAVKVSPDYSNALYSLGLLYESQGDKGRALGYYYKVKDINPGNKDIVNKIRNLLGESGDTKQ